MRVGVLLGTVVFDGVNSREDASHRPSDRGFRQQPSTKPDRNASPALSDRRLSCMANLVFLVSDRDQQAARPGHDRDQHGGTGSGSVAWRLSAMSNS